MTRREWKLAATLAALAISALAASLVPAEDGGRLPAALCWVAVSGVLFRRRTAPRTYRVLGPAGLLGSFRAVRKARVRGSEKLPPGAPEFQGEDPPERVEANPNPPERLFLEGPRSRLKEFLSVWKIAREFIQGFRTLHFVGPCVTVFGSARFQEGHPFYDLAETVGARLAQMGFTVMTGGGPGIMEAASRGAKDAGGFTVGCNVVLPEEQKVNPWVDRSITFEHFFVRKVMLVKYSYAFVVLPGGLGTMDELYEALTLIQTRKIDNFPVVLMSTEYYRPLMGFLAKMVAARTISNTDLDLLLVTDSVEEAMDHIHKHAIASFGLGETPFKLTALGE